MYGRNCLEVVEAISTVRLEEQNEDEEYEGGYQAWNMHTLRHFVTRWV